MNFGIKLSFHDFILGKDGPSNENHNFDFKISYHIIAPISENDVY